MVALVRSLQVGPAKLVTLTLALSVACATAEEPEDDGPRTPSGGSGVIPGGGSGSLGGSSNASAGKPAGTGGTGTGTSGTGAGATSSTGGVPSGTAGTTPTGTAGTTPTGTAGTSSGTCPPYTGTLATDSLIFTGGFGKSKMGTWSGYGFTFTYGTATVTPGEGTSCFAGAKFCASGTVPASDSAGAGLGWNIGQVEGSMTVNKVAVTTPVKLTFAGVAPGMRAQLSVSDTVSYCYTFTDTEVAAKGATVPLASFKTECWGTEGTAYDGTPIASIQIVIPGSATGGAKTFDVCVLDIEPG